MVDYTSDQIQRLNRAVEVFARTYDDLWRENPAIEARKLAGERVEVYERADAYIIAYPEAAPEWEELKRKALEQANT